MWRRCLILFWILVIALPLQAQEIPPYRYAFFYLSTGDQLRILSYIEGDSRGWIYETVPARVLAGEVRDQFTMPQWSPDGFSLYLTTYQPNSETVAVNLARYDLLTQTLSPIATLAASDTAELVSVESVSLDGRFAWTRQLIGQKNQLVDLDSGAIWESEFCPARVLTWTAQEVIVACIGTGFNTPEIFALDVLTGNRTRAFFPPPNTLAAQNPLAVYVQSGRFLADGRLLVGTFDGGQASAVGLLSGDSYTGDYFGVSSDVRLNSDESELAFWQEGRLIRVNLETMRQRVYDLVASDGWGWGDGDQLGFWRLRTGQADTVEIYQVAAYATGRTEETLAYHGPSPNRQTFAPDHIPAFALEFQPEAGQAYVEVYYEGELTWVSDFEYPDSFIVLNPAGQEAINWVRGTSWLNLLYTPEHGRVQLSHLAVEAEQGQSIIVPWYWNDYVTATPDGAWLMTLSIENAVMASRHLVAVNRSTEQSAIVYAYDNLPQFLQNPAYRAFSWSPLSATLDSE